MPTNKDLLVGAQAGTTNFYAAVYNVLDGDEANPRIKLFDTFGASVQALKSGDVDTGADGPGLGRRLHRRLARRVQESSASPLGTEEFGFIFTPGSDLVAPGQCRARSR